ncbi:MAG: hypothetical protein NWE76_10740 [Candidatus Bathyarchaeota archaeon]|nr:hypothetical protein [Candidatus Bathyarchaeota archaeon]
MATFEMDHAVQDMEKATLLPGDWYVCRIMKEPKVVPNNKKKAGLSPEEGAGENLRLFVRVQSEERKFHGRAFTLNIPWPGEEDKEEFDAFSGVNMYDVKYDRLRNWSAAFKGKKPDAIKGKKLSFDPGDEALLYIDDTEYDWRDGHEEDLINSIDVFRMIPRPAE